MKIIKILLLLLIFQACSKTATISPTLPDSRSFYMGFTAFPYDYTLDALQETYENVGKDGDILLTHLDAGIPWDEAFNDGEFPASITKALQEALDALSPNQKLFLTTTPTDQSRNHLAKYWNDNGEHQVLPENWKNKTFNDPDVVDAFINYCKRIITFTNPDYFAYSIEINNSFVRGSSNFANYLELAEKVYTALKLSFPDLPIIVTLQGDSFEIPKEDLLANSKDLLEFSDYVAMSSYPFLTSTNLKRDADPALFANNWLEEFSDLAPNKPFAISETAFIAEDIELESVGIKAKGKEEWQREYLQKLFLHANALDAEFLIWFIYRDYDAIYDLAPSDVFRIWRDTGLKNENGKERESYDLWQDWMELDKE